MRFGIFTFLFLSGFLASAQAAEAPVKPSAKSITVYQDPG